MSVCTITVSCNTHLYFSYHYKLIFTFTFFPVRSDECSIYRNSTPYSCQNSFCNPQNTPFLHHNVSVGTPWLTNIWVVKSHRYNQTSPNVQLPVRMLTAIVRKCGPRWRKLKHSAGDDGMIKTACLFGMSRCDFFWTLSALTVVMLVFSYILT
jgi:hypothetical protein